MTRPLLYDFPGSICCQMVRVTLAEKGVDYDKRHIDIGAGDAQFESWYVALNPKAVVPTLAIGDEIVTNTHNIVRRIDAMEGPALTPASDDGREAMGRWMMAIMAPHFGVPLYAGHLDDDGRCPRIVARGEELRRMGQARPELAELLDKRIAGNERFQAILADPAAIEAKIDELKALVVDMEATLSGQPYLAGPTWSLADAYATAALARFELHGYAPWWEGGASPAVDAYYQQLQTRPSWEAAGVVNRGSVL